MPESPTGLLAGRAIIGLDVGTTGVKAVAFGLDTRSRAVAVREYPLMHPAPFQEVQDPAVILGATTSALAECVSRAREASVVGISLSAAMHGLMALDSDLHPITPLLTWADGRAGAEALEFHRDGRAGDLQSATGTPVHPMAPLSKLLWFSKNDPETWTRAKWWLSLKDFVLLGLTGVLATEVSSASGTGLVDINTKSWSQLALRACGVRAESLPDIVPTTFVLALAPEVALDVGLTPGTPVVAGAADGPLSNLGTGAISPGVAALSLGTSGAVRTVCSEPRTDRSGTMFCYPLVEPLWVVGGAISNGAEAVRWAGRTLLPAAAGSSNFDEVILGLAASVPPGCDGVAMMPFLLPERSPLWNSDLFAAVVGLRHDHSAAHLIRSCLEGVCLQMKDLVDRLDSVYPLTSVRATGGAFRSPLWRQVMAAAINRPFYVVGEAEGTALGAAILGLVALGEATSLDDASAILSGPDGPKKTYIEASPTLSESLSDIHDRTRQMLSALIFALGKDRVRP